MQRLLVVFTYFFIQNYCCFILFFKFILALPKWCGILVWWLGRFLLLNLIWLMAYVKTHRIRSLLYVASHSVKDFKCINPELVYSLFANAYSPLPFFLIESYQVHNQLSRSSKNSIMEYCSKPRRAKFQPILCQSKERQYFMWTKINLMLTSGQKESEFDYYILKKTCSIYISIKDFMWKILIFLLRIHLFWPNTSTCFIIFLNNKCIES